MSFRLRIIAFVCLLAAAAGLGLSACDDTGSGAGLPPITGILVRADLLFSDIGCGREPGEAYKYTAHVFRADGTFVAASLTDCYVDANFVNLGNAAAGPEDYIVQIAVFDRVAFEAQQASIEASRETPDGLKNVQLTFRSRCFATQRKDVLAVAACDPLRSGGTGTLRLETASFGGESPLAPTDAGADADDGGDDAGDAGDDASADAAPTDAGPMPAIDAGPVLTCGVDYDTVQVTVPSPTGPTDAGRVACPETVRTPPLSAPATISLDVELSQAGTPRAQVRCQGKTTPGFELEARCAPPTP